MSTGGIHMGRVRPRWRSRLTVLLALVIITWRVLYSGVAGGHLYWDFFHVGHCLCRSCVHLAHVEVLFLRGCCGAYCHWGGVDGDLLYLLPFVVQLEVSHGR